MITQPSASRPSTTPLPPSYAQVHLAARAIMATTCRDCGKSGRLDAALRPDVPASRTLIEPRHGLRYSFSPYDYEALCRSCHVRQDKAGGAHCDKGHELAPDNIRTGRGQRRCRTCYEARYQAHNRERYADPERRAAVLAANRKSAGTPEARAKRNARLKAQRAAARRAA